MIRDIPLHILNITGQKLPDLTDFPSRLFLAENEPGDLEFLKTQLTRIPPNEPAVIFCRFNQFLTLSQKEIQDPEHYYWIVVDQESEVPVSDLNRYIADGLLFDVLEGFPSQRKTETTLTRLLRHYTKKYEFDEVKNHLRRLNKIAIALSTEEEISIVLDSILSVALELTDADSGTLYFLEQKTQTDLPLKTSSRNKQMRFIYTKNESAPVALKNEVMELNTSSLAGYCAVTGEILEFEDVYRIPPGKPYSFNRSFDEKNQYRSKSMLIVPLKNHRKETIGVLQLINKKSIHHALLTTPEITDQVVIPFTEFDKEISESFGSQAAVAFENKQLFSNLQAQFSRVESAQREKMNSLVSLVSGIAHEVNNPINYISNSVQPIRQDLSEISHIISVLASLSEVNREDVEAVQVPDHAQEFKDLFIRLVEYAHEQNLTEVADEILELAVIIDKGAAKITGIVRSLMSFNLLIESNRQPVNLPQILEMAIQSTQKEIRKPLPVIPDFGPIPTVESNSDMLHIIFSNILKNSAEAIPADGGEIKITMTGNEDFVTIRIQDNGPGIPSHVVPRIFDAFYTTQESKGKIGMGLFVAYNMVQKLNGVLKYDPSPAGACFILQLPTNQANLEITY